MSDENISNQTWLNFVDEIFFFLASLYCRYLCYKYSEDDEKRNDSVGLH